MVEKARAPEMDEGTGGNISYQSEDNQNSGNGSVKNDFSLQQYMREVNMSPLLSHEQTIDIFRSLEETRGELEKLNKRSDYTPEHSRAVSKLKREIARLKEKLVVANLRLVVYLANRYRNRGIAIQDLVQEGNIGLIRAIEKFDHRLGFRFSTYATWWIRQGMLRAIHQQGRLIRIPTHMLEKFQRFMRDEGHESRKPNGHKTLVSGEETNPPESEMVHLMEVMRDPLSLDNRMTDDGLDLQEVTSDEGDIPESLLIDQDLRNKLREAISSLTFREEIILRMRYGIDLPETHTLEEVGQIFGLTKERIRQIESRALRRLHDTHAS